MEKLMTAQDVKRYANIKSVRTVYRKAQTGEIPCYRIGSAVRFKKSEIDEVMKGDRNAKKE